MGSEPTAPRGLARHGAGFVASGIVALGVDMGVLALLTRVAGLSPFIARPISIACAMIAGWLCHRSWTFVVTTPPTLVEFARYAAVAWGAAAINYALYAAILFASPALAPEAALGLSSLAAMATSYLGMRFGVFTR